MTDRTAEDVIRECRERAERYTQDDIQDCRRRGIDHDWNSIYWPTYAGVLRAKIEQLMGETP